MTETFHWFKTRMPRSIAIACLFFGVCCRIPAQPAAAPHDSSASNEQDLTYVREQLLQFLRMSPTLTAVVAADPTLLANQDYISRSNPELGRFLSSHPEVVRNPDFYLFANLSARGGRHVEALQRRVWPEAYHSDPDSATARFLNQLGSFFMILIIIGSLIWLIRVLLENRRWGRMFRLQMDVHGKLIEKFGTNQELLTYMNTEAGKRFLEAAPIPVNFEQDQRIPAAFTRVLVPLQIGVVLVLLGSGLLVLRGSITAIATPLLVFGTVTLMPGLGFILSAGVTWMLAGRLGLLPQRAESLSAGERQ